jgi:hypothetical protein
MIQSAMIFALGFFVSGLVWLAFSVALVRRTRRLTERRLLAGIATRRAEFETERDELRARHAVQMHRLEREVSHVLDMATSYRLEADLKERDLLNAQAELIADAEDFRDIERRLTAERDLVQDLERRHAEAGAALRAAQYALNLETKRRATAEEALDEASVLADQRRLAVVALRGENDSLRARLDEEPGDPVPFEVEHGQLPRAVNAPTAVENGEPVPQPQPGGSVVPLPTRQKHAAQESPDQSVAVVAEATRDLQRLAEEAKAEPKVSGEEAAAAARIKGASTAANVGELVALRMAPEGGKGKPEGAKAKAEEPGADGSAEDRFFAALAEIRALKRTANQAGE